MRAIIATRPVRWLAVLALGLLAAACTGGRARTGVLEPDGSARFALMDFSQPLDFEALPDGWSHRSFRRHAPMDLRLVRKDGRDALRASTHGTASMLFRQVDVALDHYPILAWEWLVTQGIDIEHDELTKADDDHPARLYLSFEGANGGSHALEIIWGNHKLGARRLETPLLRLRAGELSALHRERRSAERRPLARGRSRPARALPRAVGVAPRAPGSPNSRSSATRTRPARRASPTSQTCTSESPDLPLRGRLSARRFTPQELSHGPQRTSPPPPAN